MQIRKGSFEWGGLKLFGGYLRFLHGDPDQKSRKYKRWQAFSTKYFCKLQRNPISTKHVFNKDWSTIHHFLNVTCYVISAFSRRKIILTKHFFNTILAPHNVFLVGHALAGHYQQDILFTVSWSRRKIYQDGYNYFLEICSKFLHQRSSTNINLG